MTQDENLATVVTAAATDIGEFIKSQREAAQVSIRQLAARAGVSNPYLSQIERGLRKPSAEVLGQIAKALRVSAEVLYIRAGILEPAESNAVRDAVINDIAITERQKQSLLDIYASFLRQNEFDQIVIPPIAAPDPGPASVAPPEERCTPSAPEPSLAVAEEPTTD